MIDTKVHRAMHGFKDGDDYCDFESLKEELGRNGGEFSDKNILICDHKIHGFSLTTKTWHVLKVELLEEIDFNLEAFESLLLPQHQKEMIHSLVKVHSSDGIGFDDLIKGKGRGMVLLLHGVTRTGKTLTAGKNDSAVRTHSPQH